MQLVEDAPPKHKAMPRVHMPSVPTYPWKRIWKNKRVLRLASAVEMNNIDKCGMQWMPNQARKEWKPSKCYKSQTFQLTLS